MVYFENGMHMFPLMLGRQIYGSFLSCPAASMMVRYHRRVCNRVVVQLLVYALVYI